MCDDYDANVAALKPHMYDFKLVHCFDYLPTRENLVSDCHSGRLPPDRCRSHIEEVVAQKRCGGLSRSLIPSLAEIAVKLGVVHDATGLCQ